MTATDVQYSTVPTGPVLHRALELGWKTWKPAFTAELPIDFAPRDADPLCARRAPLVGSLSWIGDVAALVRTRSEMCWEGVLDEAQRLHGQRLVLLGLALANDFRARERWRDGARYCLSRLAASVSLRPWRQEA
jgi:hypothetical protein